MEENIPSSLLRELTREVKGVDRSKSTPSSLFDGKSFRLDLPHGSYELDTFKIETKSTPMGGIGSPMRGLKFESSIQFSSQDHSLIEEFVTSDSMLVKKNASVHQFDSKGDLFCTFTLHGMLPHSVADTMDEGIVVDAICDNINIEQF